MMSFCLTWLSVPKHAAKNLFLSDTYVLYFALFGWCTLDDVPVGSISTQKIDRLPVTLGKTNRSY